MVKGPADAAQKKPEAPAGQQQGGGEHAPKKSAEAPAPKSSKGHNPLPGGCHAWGCKAQAHRFNFCDTHYDHFKFGLIKKTGEQVPDYDKKLEHFQAYQARQTTPLRKAA
jgi:hypothetical protein